MRSAGGREHGHPHQLDSAGAGNENRGSRAADWVLDSLLDRRAAREYDRVGGVENPLREAGDFVRMLRDYLEDREVSVLFRDGSILALDLLLGALETHPGPGEEDGDASGRPGDAFLGLVNDLAAVPETPLERDAVPTTPDGGRQTL